MNEQQKIIDLLQQSLNEKTNSLAETRARLTEANNLIIDICREINKSYIGVSKRKIQSMVDKYAIK